MNKPAQAEPIQHTMYLNINRNWTSEEGDGTFYEDKVFFLKDGRIGMKCCGRVITTSIEAWMSLAEEGMQNEH